MQEVWSACEQAGWLCFSHRKPCFSHRKPWLNAGDVVKLSAWCCDSINRFQRLFFLNEGHSLSQARQWLCYMSLVHRTVKRTVLFSLLMLQYTDAFGVP